MFDEEYVLLYLPKLEYCNYNGCQYLSAVYVRSSYRHVVYIRSATAKPTMVSPPARRVERPNINKKYSYHSRNLRPRRRPNQEALSVRPASMHVRGAPSLSLAIRSHTPTLSTYLELVAFVHIGSTLSRLIDSNDHPSVIVCRIASSILQTRHFSRFLCGFFVGSDPVVWPVHSGSSVDGPSPSGLAELYSNRSSDRGSQGVSVSGCRIAVPLFDYRHLP
jgi:hypothetical protein